MSPTGTRELGDVPEAPSRDMPESSSKQEAVEATISHISPTSVPKMPKPILKQPHFELGQETVDSPAQEPTRVAEEEADEVDPLSEPLGKARKEDGLVDSLVSRTGASEEELHTQPAPSAPFLAATKA